MIIACKFYSQEEFKPINDNRKYHFLQFIRRRHRRRHAHGTAVGGKGDCVSESDSNRRRRPRG